jgi:hypothetical protein
LWSFRLDEKTPIETPGTWRKLAVTHVMLRCLWKAVVGLLPAVSIAPVASVVAAMGIFEGVH